MAITSSRARYCTTYLKRGKRKEGTDGSGGLAVGAPLSGDALLGWAPHYPPEPFLPALPGLGATNTSNR